MIRTIILAFAVMFAALTSHQYVAQGRLIVLGINGKDNCAAVLDTLTGEAFCSPIILPNAERPPVQPTPPAAKQGV